MAAPDTERGRPERGLGRLGSCRSAEQTAGDGSGTCVVGNRQSRDPHILLAASLAAPAAPSPRPQRTIGGPSTGRADRQKLRFWSKSTIRNESDADCFGYFGIMGKKKKRSRILHFIACFYLNYRKFPVSGSNDAWTWKTLRLNLEMTQSSRAQLRYTVGQQGAAGVNTFALLEKRNSHLTKQA